MYYSQIRNASIGHTVVISTNFTNTNREELGITFLIEVRDESGVTLHLAWQTANISPMSTRSAGVSWTSDKAGEYQVRVFVISNLTSPQALGPVETAQFVMLEPEEEKKVYRLELDGLKYDIQYSLGSGYVKDVVVEKDISTLSVSLTRVNKNTILTLMAPRELLFKVFSCGIEPLPTDPDYAVEGFIDTIPINAFFELGVTAWEIPVEAGSQEITFAGTCFA
jgi:hypothetical protein